MKKKTVQLDAYGKATLQRAAGLLSKGELVAVPTETVYGLAADARQEEAVQKIFIAKQRPEQHPLIVHIASIDQLSEWAQNIPEIAYKLAQAFWPGPLTLLLQKADQVTTIVTGGLNTIAIRVPSHPIMQELLQLTKTGLAAPSANAHKKISPTTAQHVLKDLDGKIAAVVDAGPCTFGLESTILDLTQSQPTIVRPGPITQKELEAVLEVPVLAPQQHTVCVAGNMQDHYQPTKPVVLISADQLQNYLEKHEQESLGVIYYSNPTELLDLCVTVPMSSDKKEYAQNLYKALHSLDEQPIDVIIIELPPVTPEWADVHDRLQKAEYKKRVK